MCIVNKVPLFKAWLEMNSSNQIHPVIFAQLFLPSSVDECFYVGKFSFAVEILSVCELCNQAEVVHINAK